MDFRENLFNFFAVADVGLKARETVARIRASSDAVNFTAFFSKNDFRRRKPDSACRTRDYYDFSADFHNGEIILSILNFVKFSHSLIDFGYAIC